LEQAVIRTEHRRQASFLLWEVCQALHDPAAAIEYLRATIRDNPLVSRAGPRPKRHVLALAVVGDFQANLPIDPLLDPADTALHTLWLDNNPPFLPERPLSLPRVDCAFITIAEDARQIAALNAADALVRRLDLPVINSARRIAATSRAEIALMLQGLAHAVVPSQRIISRAGLAREPQLFPIVIRPRFSHAGSGLARIDDPTGLSAYLDGAACADWFYVAPFVDYRSADGQWRKYRVIFVDGTPWPFHMAIHDDWAVWYYNAGMAASVAKRDEEARFLSNIGAVFPPQAMAALRGIAQRVGLDYFGLDCGLMPDGDLVVFEVETGMIVHDRDSADLYPYKKLFVPRIFRAVETMIDARVAAWQRQPGTNSR
jgi:glutathione synthase/RimK-type ligase-like ATP-grasp enzyme